jgi:septal ring-binding cell division protein DamX
LLASLLLSMGALGYIYHEQLLDEWAALESYLKGPSKAAPLTTTEVAAAASPIPPASTVGMSSSNTPTPLKPTDAVSTEQGEAVVKPVEPPPKPPEPIQTAEPIKAVDATAKPPEPPKATEPVKPPEPPKAAKPAEKPAVKSPEVAATQADDVAWVRQLQDDAWVMQHAAFDSLSEARSFQASSLGYRGGQVFFTQRKSSKPYYILITGPYADKAQAEALMRQNPPLAKAWLRSAKALKIQFQD